MSPGPSPPPVELECLGGRGGVHESAFQQPAPEVLMGTIAPSTETTSVPRLYGPQKTGRDRVVGLGVEREGSIALLSPVVPAPPQPTEQVPDIGSTGTGASWPPPAPGWGAGLLQRACIRAAVLLQATRWRQSTKNRFAVGAQKGKPLLT